MRDRRSCESGDNKCMRDSLSVFSWRSSRSSRHFQLSSPSAAYLAWNLIYYCPLAPFPRCWTSYCGMPRHWDALAGRFVYRSSGAQDFGQSQIGVRGAQEANRERAHGIMGRGVRYPRDLESSVEARDRKIMGVRLRFAFRPWLYRSFRFGLERHLPHRRNCKAFTPTSAFVPFFLKTHL